MLNTLEMSQEQAARVSAYATALRLAIPGVHLPGRLPAHFTFDFLADAVRHVLDELGHQRVSIHGISYGGNIAYHFAARYPDAVERLLLTGTAGPGGLALYDPALWESLALRWRTSPREEFAEEMTALLTGTDWGLAAEALQPMRRMVQIWARRLTEDSMQLGIDCGLRMESLTTATVPVPALAVTGEHDAWTPPEACRQLVSAWPDARFTTIRQSDHFVPMTRPAEHADLARRFFLGKLDDMDEQEETVGDFSYCTAWERFQHSTSWQSRSPV
ncbi:alpha/beta fold hydrolase [Streptomyces sp. SID12501]|uniref:Alpha/beta fold hydrolase n=1 Tax=Streptomyces sp. SID12501 TaxID=2706042 RepID=A0A6B3BQ29_9ACTN|nr:alpha/beta hydrolase [Streptomyces sp. SID12501]NEC86408.1 alpha/beta fold hydrolase [Streptomyces sp. SID12501]